VKDDEGHPRSSEMALFDITSYQSVATRGHMSAIAISQLLSLWRLLIMTSFARLKIYDGSRDPDTPLSEVIFHLYTGTCYGQSR